MAHRTPGVWGNPHRRHESLLQGGFLFPAADRLFIMDWKTGKPDSKKHRSQMVGYTAWAAYHFEKNPAEISPIVAYLHPSLQREPYYRQFI
jgi:hypothetical protein